jgi:hypothetical protein
MLVAFSIPEFNIKKQISWAFHVDYCSESSCTYDVIIGSNLLEELGIIMNFNDLMVILDTDTIPMKDRDICTLSSLEALIEVILSTNQLQTLRDEFSQATKFLDAEYKPASFYDVIK